METLLKISPPADVPKDMHQTYSNNYRAITRNSGRLLLFACDQKIEHGNKDFYGEGIHPDAMQPEHLFAIASKGIIGAMAAPLGLIARYGNAYPTINYVIKLNAKTNFTPPSLDPWSHQLWRVDDVIRLKQEAQLPVCGIGFTIYLGSEYEGYMLEHAAQAIFQAHQHGLVAIVWAYPRGKNISDDQNPELLAGAAGIAHALGADFVKIKPAHQPSALRLATLAAGNTKVICSGGEIRSAELFLKELYAQLHEGGTAGCAVGRNLFQRSLPDAIALSTALSALVIDQATLDDALKIFSQLKNKS